MLLPFALCAGAEEPPPAPGVSVEVRSEQTEFAIGDPILLDVVYRNDGEGTWEVCEEHVLMFYDPFDVRDTQGAKVPNPFADIDYAGYDGPVTRHRLGPGASVTIRKYVNESAAFEKPGEYVVTARGSVSGPRDGGIREFRCPKKPLRIRLLPPPDKRTRDSIASDLKALAVAPKLRDRDEHARYRPHVTDSNGRTDALRLLAFRRDQGLLPFWLERLDDKSREARWGDAFVPEALAGLPDRTAVLKALEERLAAGERDRCLWIYTCLAAPKTDDVTWEEVFARRREIEKGYK